MKEETIKMLEKLALNSTIHDEDGNYACVDDYAGGNVDDAYRIGHNDGQIELARIILKAI